METLHITFLRHGRSLADDEGVLEGRYDSPLTLLGENQASARASAWMQEGVQFNLVICSPLQRALATARIIAACLEIPIETDPGWMEMDNGPLAGLARDEANKRYPIPAFRNPFEPMAGSGESEIGLHSRAAQAVEQIIRRGPGHYLVVAHGGILNAALRVIIGAPFPVNFSGIWFEFTDLGYARFEYNPQQHIWHMLELTR